MAMTLNEFEVGGRIQVSNFAQPALKFDLATKDIDVDALLEKRPAVFDGR